MTVDVVNVDLSKWVAEAEGNPSALKQRQIIEIALKAISLSDPFADVLFLKGGILMGLAYGSPRLTADIDFTADFAPSVQTPDELAKELNRLLPIAAAMLGYAGFALKVISATGDPKRHYPEAQAPAIKIKIAFADRGTNSESALFERNVGEVISIDVSFKEPMKETQILKVSEGYSIKAYALTEMVSEKFRSVLQQKKRRRQRRQDIFDISYILSKYQFCDADKLAILERIIDKSKARGIEATRLALRDQETRDRSQAEWHTLNAELEAVPDFDETYEIARSFYEALPWGDKT